MLDAPFKHRFQGDVSPLEVGRPIDRAALVVDIARRPDADADAIFFAGERKHLLHDQVYLVDDGIRLVRYNISLGQVDDLAICGNGARCCMRSTEVNADREVWEYAALVTSLTSEIVTIGQAYRDRADSENNFDELKNQWGWGGFTTQDLKRCRLMARCVALVFNWWNLFTRLADPEHHREAITSRPLLLQAIARQTTHAGRTTLTVTSTHGDHHRARQALTRIAAFFAELRSTAEQLTALDRWYRILSQALIKFLRGRKLVPPPRLRPA